MVCGSRVTDTSAELQLRARSRSAVSPGRGGGGRAIHGLLYSLEIEMLDRICPGGIINEIARRRRKKTEKNRTATEPTHSSSVSASDETPGITKATCRYMPVQLSLHGA